jgi:hypothetical protein
MVSSSGTPALGDLNGNGILDILYVETTSFSADDSGVVLLEFPGVMLPSTTTVNSFRGMPVHNEYFQ